MPDGVHEVSAKRKRGSISDSVASTQENAVILVNEGKAANDEGGSEASVSNAIDVIPDVDPNMLGADQVSNDSAIKGKLSADEVSHGASSSSSSSSPSDLPLTKRELVEASSDGFKFSSKAGHSMMARLNVATAVEARDKIQVRKSQDWIFAFRDAFNSHS
jgi:hypothetical protein